jgi:cytosine/adenosine deaminase-related metal-dependent hydrolase
MKILIENIAIYTESLNREFIDKGYLYIDKGLIIAVGEGMPPPELEFADYIIDGKYAVALPGFAVGIGNIVDYMLRFKSLANRKEDILTTLSLSDIQTLASVALASLVLNGVTSIVTYVNPLNTKILSGIAMAANECWVRVRMLIPIDGLDVQTVEDLIKSALKSIKEPDASVKGVITFGFYAKKQVSKEFLDLAKSLNVKLYIEGILANNELLLQNPEDIIVISQRPTIVPSNIKKVVINNINQWKKGLGYISHDPLNLNPRNMIYSISKAFDNPRTILDILCHFNPINLGIGTKSIEEGNIADIILLDYSKPPVGPIPITEIDIVNEISMLNYVVETVLVAGELTLDQGLTLNIGDKHIKKAQSIIENLKH